MRRGTTTFTAALAAVALMLGACGGDDDTATTTPTSTAPSGSSPAGLAGRTFLSVDVTQDGAPRPLVPGTRISLTFDGDLGASAGCNSFGGPYRLDGDVLVVDQLGGTEMGCDPERHEQDEWLVAFLTDRPTVALDGDELVLATDATRITLVDREVADPDRPLVGPTWTLDTIIEGDVASSVPAGVTATLTFLGDGTVGVATGCNTGGGPADIGDTTITFGAIGTTLRACGPDEGAVESAVLAVLNAGEVAYEIDANRLTLTADDHGLGFTAE